MRKLIVELKLGDFVESLWGDFFERVEKVEAIEILRLDTEQGKKVVLTNIRLKDGYELEDLELPQYEIIGELKSDGNKYTCVVSVDIPERFKGLLKEFDLNLVWDTPIISTRDKMVLSCIGAQESLEKFLDAVEFLGDIENVSFQKPVFQNYNIFSLLTEKQKETVLTAKKNGYYRSPREINLKKISEKLDISKSTAAEHLRKAENRIMSSITEGYQKTI